MAVLISYDLHNPEKHYPILKDALEKLCQHIKVLESVYLLKTDLSAAEVVGVLTHFIDEDDELFAVTVTNDIAGKLTDPERMVYVGLAAN